ncbi:MAG: hypothetical protein WBX00_19020 [Isosphaeraceae bacterium]
MAVGLEAGLELEPEAEADRGRGVAGAGAVAGGSRAGGVIGGTWSWAPARLAQKSSPDSPPAKTPLVIATLAFRTIHPDNKS